MVDTLRYKDWLEKANRDIKSAEVLKENDCGFVNQYYIEDLNLKVDGNTEDTVLANENKKEVLEIIEKLEKTDREIIIKKYFYNKKASEIAEEVGLSVSAVENRIWRTKDKHCNKKIETNLLITNILKTLV